MITAEELHRQQSETMIEQLNQVPDCTEDIRKRVYLITNRVGKTDLTRMMLQSYRESKRRPSKRWEHAGKDWE